MKHDVIKTKVLMLLTLVISFLIFLNSSLNVKQLDNTTVLPIDLDKVSYSISFNDDNILTIKNNDREDVVLVLAAMRPFEIHVNDELSYSYTSTDYYSRLHEISIPTGTSVIEIKSGSQQYSIKALLTTKNNSENGKVVSLIFSFAFIGLNFATSFFALILYTTRKRKDSYLLVLGIVAILSMIITFLTSPITIFINDKQYVFVQRIINIIMKPMCSIACVYLLKNENEKITDTAYIIHGISIILLCLTYIGGIKYCSIATNILLFIYDMYVISDTEKNIWTYMIGISVSIMASLALYTALPNNGYLPNTEQLIYLYTPQFSWSFFILTMIGFVSQKFAYKFNEADELNIELDKKVEERTRELTLQKEQKNNMILNVFHDLKSPLFGAIGCADMIQGNEEDQEILGILKERLQFVSNLIEQLFMMSKLENHKIQFNNDEVEMSTYVSHILESFQIQCKEKNIQVISSLHEEIYSDIDKFRMNQAIDNILQNALKYSNENSSIEVSLYKENSNCILEIKDHGQGIDANDLPHIFERYYQGTYNSSSRSAGLGLSIAYQIVQEENGSIEVESEKGKGSCFKIILPCVNEIRCLKNE